MATAIALVVLVGKLVDSTALQSFGGAQTMRTATAIALIVAAGALLTRGEAGALLAARPSWR